MAMRMAADGNNSMTNADAHTQEVFTERLWSQQDDLDTIMWPSAFILEIECFNSREAIQKVLN